MQRLTVVIALSLAFTAFCEEPPKQKMVALDLELPKPLFIGTPEKLKTANLEAPPKGDRPKFMVPEGTMNVSLNKTVTSSDKDPFIGKLEQITDGSKEANDASYVELWKGLQWVQIDLKSAHNIYAIAMWHFHAEPRVYRDVIVQVADDPEFITNVRTLFNNDHDNSAGLGVGKDREYVDNNEGKLLDAKGEKARYLRFYSQGSTASEQNHYIEIEVYGKEAK